jgi:predicted nucleotidyltransferase component of viral defense system
MREVRQAVSNAIGFEDFVNIQVLALEDFYGGKICAALPRQHPRDLFDLKILFEDTLKDVRLLASVYKYESHVL